MWLVKRLIGFLLGRILPIPIPRTVSGVGSSAQIGRMLSDMGCKKPLVVTDEILMKHGLLKPCLDALKGEGMEHQVFDAVVPNPHSELVEQGYELYKSGNCDCIIAFGGGSPMDCAKVIGAKVANPQPSVEAYQGFLNVNMLGLKPLPPLVAVPTTAGTGSETTVAAIITLKKESRKIMIADLGLVPSVAVFDPQILEKLPPHITAATGMDALTHAVESYIGGWSSPFSRKMSLQATEKIFKHLLNTYKNGVDLQAREQMLTAAFEAGIAFTRANVGYVHAIAHQFGGMFQTPHGDANAMLLPHVLAFYLDNEQPGLFSSTPTTDVMCDLAIAAGLIPSGSLASKSAKSGAAQQFVARVAQMNAEMKIPTEIATMKASDVDEVVSRALAEAHGTRNGISHPVSYLMDLGYPVPMYMMPKDCAGIVAKVLPAGERKTWENINSP